jgi:hypothetical protein
MRPNNGGSIRSHGKKSSSREGPRRRPFSEFRPRLEFLEDRLAPAAVQPGHLLLGGTDGSLVAPTAAQASGQRPAEPPRGPGDSSTKDPCVGGSNCLFYGGWANGVNGLTNENGTAVTDAKTFDDFSIGSGAPFHMTGFFVDDLMSTTATAVDVTILGPGQAQANLVNGGLPVAYSKTGIPISSIVETGNNYFGYEDYRVTANGLNSVPTLSPGHYYISVQVVGNGTGQAFTTTTSGAGGVGCPVANGDVWLQSSYFGYPNFTDWQTLLGPGKWDISQGILGDGVSDCNTTNTTTALASSPNPSKYNGSVTFTATVTPNSGTGTPTGTVTFLDGGNALATVNLTNGSASYATSALTIGTHAVTAEYSGDGSNDPSTSAVDNQVVNQDDTAVTVTSSINPSVWGQGVTFQAHVAALPPGVGVPTGTVTFLDGGNALGTVGLDGSGNASLSTDKLSVAAHAITVTYNGDATFATSTSAPLTQTVNKAATAVALTADINPSVFGQQVTFSVAVTAVPPGAGVPTGNVAIMEGQNVLGNIALDGTGKGGLALKTLTTGAHNLTAVYQGDANFNGANSAVLNQVVNKAQTAITLSSSDNPSFYGESIDLTAKVSVVPPGGGCPSGTVTFSDNFNGNVTVLLVKNLGNCNQATLTINGLFAGVHNITADYSGDVNFADSTVTNAQNVAKALPTLYMYGFASNTYGHWQLFQFNCQTQVGGEINPTGWVNVRDAGTVLWQTPFGQTWWATPFLAVGVHPFTLDYPGDDNFMPAAWGTFTFTNSPSFTTNFLNSDKQIGTMNQPITFTALIRPFPMPDVFFPTGTVVWKADGKVLGTTQLVNPNGITQFTYTFSQGVHMVTDTYLGNPGFNSSTGYKVQLVTGPNSLGPGGSNNPLSALGTGQGDPAGLGAATGEAAVAPVSPASAPAEPLAASPADPAKSIDETGSAVLPATPAQNGAGLARSSDAVALLDPTAPTGLGGPGTPDLAAILDNGLKA